MVNIGTLTAFGLVSLAVPILRKSRPDLERSFKVPFSPVLPILAALVCLYLALNLSIETWLRFVVWMILGFAIYFALRLRAQPGRPGRGRAGRGLLGEGRRRLSQAEGAGTATGTAALGW